MRLLFIHMAALGDGIMASPALAELRAGLPGAEIVILARRAGARYFERLDWIDRVVTFPETPWVDRARVMLLPLAVPRVAGMVWELRRMKFDVAVQWRNHIFDSAVSAFTGASVRVAGRHEYLWSSRWERNLVRGGRVDQVQVPGGLHLAEVVAAPLRRLLEREGAGRNEGPLGALQFPVTAAERARACELLEKWGLAEGGYAQVSISSETRTNDWPAAKWAAVVSGLGERYGLPVLVEGLPRDREIEAEICRVATGRVVPACGLLSLGEVGETIRRAKLLVSFNSAPIHIAAAVGTPVVVVNGRDGYAMSPWRVPHVIVTHNRFFPSRHPDREKWRELIQRVQPEEVLTGVDGLLRGGPVGPGGEALEGADGGRILRYDAA